MSDSVRPQRRQPTRLPRPWDSPGKNTGVGCHILLQCMKVKSESEVAQSCPTLCDPIDGSPPGSPIPGIIQARMQIITTMRYHLTRVRMAIIKKTRNSKCREDVKKRESLGTVGETVNWCERESRSLVSDSLRPHGLYSPWNSSGQNTGVGSLSLLQGIFPTQGSNPGLPLCRQILYQLSHKKSP